MRTVTALRYVTPLREGGSLPAIVEADDLGTYVVKFRGAGQGVKALAAELVAGEVGRALGLRVPDIVLIEVDPALGRSEPDPEIRALLLASGGTNLALDYLPGSLAFDPAAARIDPRLAARIVWFDALVTNVDRTPRNTNLLVWHRELYLIDHGAALFFHHDPGGGLERARAPFPHSREHVLLPFAADVRIADAELAQLLTREVIRGVVDELPDAWFDDPPAARHRYETFFQRRLAEPRLFVDEAEHARAQL